MPAIGAVVTAFNPDLSLLESLRSILAQTDLLVVVNDSPAAGGSVLRQASELGAHLVEHPANLGIAAALNTGIAELRMRLPDARGVLTCDQDSRLPDGYVAALVEAWAEAEAAGVPVGMVAPSAAGNIRRLPGTQQRDGVMIGGEPIQSGLLIPISTLDQVGSFDESLFIDGVDSDFYLRAVDAGLVSVVAPMRLEHQLGRTVNLRLGPFQREQIVAADYRYYYRVRNILLVGRRHATRHPRWLFQAIAKELRHELITQLFVPGRLRRMRYAILGLMDGLRGRHGKRGLPAQ